MSRMLSFPFSLLSLFFFFFFFFLLFLALRVWGSWRSQSWWMELGKMVFGLLVLGLLGDTPLLGVSKDLELLAGY
ncbi:uncharacterized protein B0T15DRAFT_92118 [Chaetomium strumarium]|uniref:Uncharacterized protein n=1 Tax=Chaetomium strumarium TaxID=1170767 RepID=A0AAJ0GXF6_9PEZI|nr:hypothetical protein B0T15DRAFT_92118 [Chaetomium strumarium]